jgi:hypothetical protein
MIEFKDDERIYWNDIAVGSVETGSVRWFTQAPQEAIDAWILHR